MIEKLIFETIYWVVTRAPLDMIVKFKLNHILQENIYKKTVIRWNILEWIVENSLSPIIKEKKKNGMHMKKDNETDDWINWRAL